MNTNEKYIYILGFAHSANKIYSETQKESKYEILGDSPECGQFFKDIEHGNSLISVQSKHAKECIDLAESFKAWTYYKYSFSKMSAKQIIDGLDLFYKDFKNRSILIEDSIYFVKKQTEGMMDTKEEINATMIWLRSGKIDSKREYKNSKGEKNYVVFP